MIPTPLYSEHPKGFLRAENFDAEDGIPLEKGSGFGNHLTRDVLTSSIVLHYIEITATTAVDVSARYSDLHLRVVGSGEGIVTTVLGQLPQGRRLHMDVQAAENASTLIIGGVTYELPAGGGVLTFISTSDGWSAPLKLDFDLRIANDLTVDGAASFTGGIFSSVRSLDDNVWTSVTVTPGNSYVLPAGFLLVYLYHPSGLDAPVGLYVDGKDQSGTFVPSVYMIKGRGAALVPSDGLRFRAVNTGSSGNLTVYYYVL
jgi:hypothetical protein